GPDAGQRRRRARGGRRCPGWPAPGPGTPTRWCAGAWALRRMRSAPSYGRGWPAAKEERETGPPRASLPGEDEVQRPAPADMGPGAAEVSEQFAVGAARFLQGVGQEAEAGGLEFARGQRPFLVGGPGQRGNIGGPPFRVEEGHPRVMPEDV